MKKISPLFFVIATILGCASENASTTTPSKTVPQLTTVSASNVTLFSAISGGTISSDGGDNITAKGVVWNNAPSPTTSLSSKTSEGSGNGSFSSSVANLAPATTYYIRAYASNSTGTSYGNEISFSTKAIVLPTISTLAVSDISVNSAISGGNISVDGGGPITARGVVWDTAKNPTISLATKTVSGTGIGNFSSTIENLEPETTYYTKAYATNSAGTAYGDEVEFKTLPAFKAGEGNVLDADGNIYQTVEINDQVWMTENLKTTKYCNGEAISNVNFSQWDGLTSGAWTYYDNNKNNNDTYGKLYNWYVASSDKNACPCGWRAATKDDWIALSFFLGIQTAGKEIKSTGTVEDQTGKWHSSSNEGTNSVGFNALPAGWGDANSSNFVFQNYKTGFWCSNSIYGKSGEYIQLDYNYPDFYFTLKDKNSAMSIRCIKN
jgi:uncharacterized protein (TIGR02145 family)